MSVFLTPERRPFYAATYLPDTPRYGMPSFRQVLDGIRVAWHSRRDRGTRARRPDHEDHRARDTPGGGAFRWTDREDAAIAQAALTEAFDPRWGGFGGAPKFPQPTVIEWLLRRAARGDDDALSMATRTLDRMAGEGSMTRSTEGSFDTAPTRPGMCPTSRRCSTTTRSSCRCTRTPGCSRATRLSERPPNARRGSCSPRCDRPAEDSYPHSTPTLKASRVATTPGRGKSSWRPWASRSRGTFGASPAGNWEGTNVLWLAEGPPETAVAAGGSAVDLDAARRLLRETRDQRTHPTVDDKVDRGLERFDHPVTQRRRSRSRPPRSSSRLRRRARCSSTSTFGTGAKACSDLRCRTSRGTRLLR